MSLPPHQSSVYLSTLGERAFQYLKERIIRHEIAGGTRLSDQEIAQEINISRTPVREAITRLAAEGLVDVVPRRGAFVIQLSARDIDEASSVREALERLGIELGVPCLEDSHIETLRAIIEHTSEAIAEGSDAAYFDLDRRFHESIVAISRNHKLIDMYDTLGATMQAIRWLRCRSREHQEQTIVWHQRILGALEERDAGRAIDITTAHIRDAKLELLQMEDSPVAADKSDQLLLGKAHWDR